MNNFYQPEKLNLWDRCFNRYKTLPINKGRELWEEQMASHGVRYGNIHKFDRTFTEYHIIDRLTGGYTVKKVYEN